MQLLDYVVVAVYLAMLIGVGMAFARLSKNTSDYVRGGGKGTWWLVGAGTLLGSISANTFTGNAAGAFQGGYTLIIFYIANCVGFLAHALFFAKRFRQTRAYTGADMVCQRFGPEVEQFYCYTGIIIGPVLSGVSLWAMSVFCSSVFGMNQQATIILLGVIVTLYATKGGKWSVMGNDFVQSLILFPITILVAVLCLKAVGGVSGFVALFSRPDLAHDFAFIKPAGEFPEDRFSWSWIVVMFIVQFCGYINFSSGGRYLAVRDGKEASYAALFCAVGMLFGATVWFIPPIVARALWAKDVLAMHVSTPGSGAYAFAALKVLPHGMIGVMVVAMFAATLSGMDSGLNGGAGTVMRNMAPAFLRVLGMKPLTDSQTVFLGKVTTVVLGLTNTIIALIYSQIRGFSLFDAFPIINSFIGLPMAIPTTVALLIKRLPRWSFFSIMGVSLIPSIWSVIDQHYFHLYNWTYTNRTFWVLAAGLLATFVSMPFYHTSSIQYRARVAELFRRMNRPLSRDECGEGNDHVQARILGRASIVLASSMLLLMLVPNPLWGRLAIAAVSGSVIGVGFLLLQAANRHERKLLPNRAAVQSESPASDALEQTV